MCVCGGGGVVFTPLFPLFCFGGGATSTVPFAKNKCGPRSGNMLSVLLTLCVQAVCPLLVAAGPVCRVAAGTASRHRPATQHHTTQ
jgi:hypothetical protein